VTFASTYEVTFISGVNQIVHGTTGANVGLAYTNTSAATIAINHTSESAANYYISGDVELASEPTWYAANAEGAPNVAAYIPSASASTAGLVDLQAQTFTGVKSLPGRTDGSAVSAGYIGETLTDSDSGTTINTSSYTDICTVTLTPGRWLVYSQCGSTGASQTGIIANLVTLGTTGTYGTTNLEQDCAAGGPTSVAFQAQVLDVVSGTATKTVILQMKSKTANGSGRGSITALRIG
jgi:hypothetical protein